MTKLNSQTKITKSISENMNISNLEYTQNPRLVPRLLNLTAKLAWKPLPLHMTFDCNHQRWSMKQRLSFSPGVRSVASEIMQLLSYLNRVNKKYFDPVRMSRRSWLKSHRSIETERLDHLATRKAGVEPQETRLWRRDVFELGARGFFSWNHSTGRFRLARQMGHFSCFSVCVGEIMVLTL